MENNDNLIMLNEDTAEYLMKNLDKGLIQFRNLKSEIHFYENYDTTAYWDYLEDSDIEFVKESFNN